MRERGAFGFFLVVLIVTIVFFSVATDETDRYKGENQSGSIPTVMINGRSFDPSFVDQGDAGRMVIVVDRQDLFIGENTVEIHWGNAPSSTMTAELPAELQQH
jgi:hypothetical protein